jgi:hypothetical protein
VEPLIPHLRGIRRFAEPCARGGALVRHLEAFGPRCVYSGDIRVASLEFWARRSSFERSARRSLH